MAWSFDGDLHVVMHDRRDPTDAEWSRYIAELQRCTTQGDWRILVYSAGGTPTGHQRHALTKTLRGHPVAVITSSPIMRAMGFVMKALDPSIRVMTPSDEDSAFAHLRLTPDHRRRALMLRDQLARQLQSGTSLDSSVMR